MFMSAIKERRITTLPATAEGDAHELTPAEIRSVLFDLARRQIDELAARPAIAALNRIMRDSLRTPLARPVE
jgi:hypothetical protein